MHICRAHTRRTCTKFQTFNRTIYTGCSSLSPISNQIESGLFLNDSTNDSRPMEHPILLTWAFSFSYHHTQHIPSNGNYSQTFCTGVKIVDPFQCQKRNNKMSCAVTKQKQKNKTNSTNLILHFRCAHYR